MLRKGQFANIRQHYLGIKKGNYNDSYLKSDNDITSDMLNKLSQEEQNPSFSAIFPLLNLEKIKEEFGWNKQGEFDEVKKAFRFENSADNDVIKGVLKLLFQENMPFEKANIAVLKTKLENELINNAAAKKHQDMLNKLYDIGVDYGALKINIYNIDEKSAAKFAYDKMVEKNIAFELGNKEQYDNFFQDYISQNARGFGAIGAKKNNKLDDQESNFINQEDVAKIIKSGNVERLFTLFLPSDEHISAGKKDWRKNYDKFKNEELTGAEFALLFPKKEWVKEYHKVQKLLNEALNDDKSEDEKTAAAKTAERDFWEKFDNYRDGKILNYKGDTWGKILEQEVDIKSYNKFPLNQDRKLKNDFWKGTIGKIQKRKAKLLEDKKSILPKDYRWKNAFDKAPLTSKRDVIENYKLYKEYKILGPSGGSFKKIVESKLPSNGDDTSEKKYNLMVENFKDSVATYKGPITSGRQTNVWQTVIHGTTLDNGNKITSLQEKVDRDFLDFIDNSTLRERTRLQLRNIYLQLSDRDDKVKFRQNTKDRIFLNKISSTSNLSENQQEKLADKYSALNSTQEKEVFRKIFDDKDFNNKKLNQDAIGRKLNAFTSSSGDFNREINELNRKIKAKKAASSSWVQGAKQAMKKINAMREEKKQERLAGFREAGKKANEKIKELRKQKAEEEEKARIAKEEADKAQYLAMLQKQPSPSKSSSKQQESVESQSSNNYKSSQYYDDGCYDECSPEERERFERQERFYENIPEDELKQLIEKAKQAQENGEEVSDNLYEYLLYQKMKRKQRQYEDQYDNGDYDGGVDYGMLPGLFKDPKETATDMLTSGEDMHNLFPDQQAYQAYAADLERLYNDIMRKVGDGGDDDNLTSKEKAILYQKYLIDNDGADPIMQELLKMYNNNQNVDTGISLVNDHIQAAAAAAGDEDENNIVKGFWASGYGGVAKHNKDLNSKIKFWGSAIGFDANFDEKFTLGTALAMVDTKVKFNTGKESNVDIKSYMLSLYGLYNVDAKLFLSGMLFGGWGDVHNNIYVSDNDKFAKGSYKTNVYGADLRAGYKQHITDQLVFTPVIGIKYTHFIEGGSTTKGAGRYNREVKKRSYNESFGLLGMKLAYHTTYNDIALIPSVKAFVDHKFSNKTPVVNVRYLWMDSFAEQLYDRKNTNMYSFGIDLTAKKENFELITGYQFNTADNYKGHQGSIKVKVLF